MGVRRALERIEEPKAQLACQVSVARRGREIDRVVFSCVAMLKTTD
jgi:hypothetical protein